ncbi:MAG TPA: hypothetical protein VJL59_13735 [Anaerolineales bacterium]|nr:hypothetical protein [Anaerolineales bacterium]
MLKRLGFHFDEMALALVVWLCSLPLVALVVIPLFGLKMAGIVALALFFAAMAVCWGMCGWKVFNGQAH